MRPILLIYERVKNIELSAEDDKNSFLGVSQRDIEEDAKATAILEATKHSSNLPSNDKSDGDKKKIYDFLKHRNVHEIFTDDKLENNFTKEYGISLQRYELQPVVSLPFKLRSVEMKSSILYSGLENTGSWCWANSSFQVLASLTAVTEIQSTQTLPEGFSSFNPLIKFLYTLRRKNTTTDKLKNEELNHYAQLLTDDMNYHNKNTFKEYTFENNNKNKYCSFENQVKLFFKESPTSSVIKESTTSNKITNSVDQHDPGELFLIFYQLFESYDSGHPEYAQLDNNIFGFKIESENYCLKTGIKTVLRYPLSPSSSSKEQLNTSTNSLYEHTIKYTFDTIQSNDIATILDCKDASLQSCAADDDNYECAFYKHGHLSLNHIGIHNKIIPEKNKIIHIQIVRESNNTPLKSVKHNDIIFPEQINVLKEKSKNKTIYYLKGITCHTGSRTSGHHIALCKRDGDWFYFSDSTVEKITNGFNDVLIYAKNCCQHLFYECD